MSTTSSSTTIFIITLQLLLLLSILTGSIPVEQQQQQQETNNNNQTTTIFVETTTTTTTTTTKPKVSAFSFLGGLVKSFLSGSALFGGGNKEESKEETTAAPSSSSSSSASFSGKKLNNNPPVFQREGGFQVSCATCRMVVNLLQNYVRGGRSSEDIARTAISVCVTFRIESELVCNGAIKPLVKHIVYIIQNSNVKETEACAFILGSDCEDEEFNEKFNWTIGLPERKTAKSLPTTPRMSEIVNVGTKRILHLSDTHLDPHYQEGSLAECGAPLCCRETWGMPQDPHLQAGKWGDYRNCDSPLRTIEHMLQHIADNHKVDYVFWTGDLPPHDIYNQSRPSNLNIIRNLTDLLPKYFPNIPIFPALGNHESNPVNCFPRPEIKGEFSISWLYDELSNSWPKLVGSQLSEDTVSKGAFYSVPVEPGLRVISLNMNYCNNKNWWLLINSTDPADELTWLTDQLSAAENASEKVYLMGHIPPGHEDCTKVWSRNFHSLVNRFRDTIAAQFYGHTHYDEILLFFDDDNLDEATNVAYLGASTTPYANMNPAYKIYTADAGNDRAILDGETYYMNLTEANVLDEPQWKKLYSYKDSYEMEDLSLQSWAKFMKQMAGNETQFAKYLNHMHRDSDSFPECDHKCMQQMLCQQVTAKSGDHSVCRHLGILSTGEKPRKNSFLA